MEKRRVLVLVGARCGGWRDIEREQVGAGFSQTARRQRPHEYERAWLCGSSSRKEGIHVMIILLV